MPWWSTEWKIPIARALHVESYHIFIEDQAGAVVKRVAAQFPYESADPTQACLKKESEEVTEQFIANLQEAVNPAGIRVLGVRLNDLTYAPEIAQAMLMRQQALALIDARKTIVEGAVEIVRDAIDRLNKAELEISDAERDELGVKPARRPLQWRTSSTCYCRSNPPGEGIRSTKSTRSLPSLAESRHTADVENGLSGFCWCCPLPLNAQRLLVFGQFRPRFAGDLPP